MRKVSFMFLGVALIGVFIFVGQGWASSAGGVPALQKELSSLQMQVSGAVKHVRIEKDGSTSVTLDGGEVSPKIKASCGADVVLGGGCASAFTDSLTPNGDDRIAVHQSYPEDAHTWSCYFRNVTPSTTVDTGLVAFAICGEELP